MSVNAELSKSRRPIKEYRGDFDIFIHPFQQEEYFKRHNLELHQLTNGATVAFGHRDLTEEAFSKVRFDFPAGSYLYNKAGKEGALHLLEHLIAHDCVVSAMKNEAYSNAVTYPFGLEFSVEGTTNPEIRDYGVYPPLDLLLNKFRQISITDYRTLQEKSNIAGEIQEAAKSYNRQVYKAPHNIIFQFPHPLRTDNLGTIESLNTITIEDIRNIYERAIIPDKMTTEVYTSGDRSIPESLKPIILDKINEFPRSDKTCFPVEDKDYERINDTFKLSNIYKTDLGIPNGLVTIYYYWILPSAPYTIDAYSIGTLAHEVKANFYEVFRASGYGYSSGGNDQKIGSSLRLMNLNMTVPKPKEVETFALSAYQLMKDSITNNLSDERIQEIIDRTNKRLKSVPKTVHDRLRDILYGLNEYGQPIDSDKVNQLNYAITPEHLNRSKDLLFSTPPAIIIAGDLR